MQGRGPTDAVNLVQLAAGALYAVVLLRKPLDSKQSPLQEREREREREREEKRDA